MPFFSALGALPSRLRRVISARMGCQLLISTPGFILEGGLLLSNLSSPHEQRGILSFGSALGIFSLLASQAPSSLDDSDTCNPAASSSLSSSSPPAIAPAADLASLFERRNSPARRTQPKPSSACSCSKSSPSPPSQPPSELPSSIPSLFLASLGPVAQPLLTEAPAFSLNRELSVLSSTKPQPKLHSRARFPQAHFLPCRSLAEAAAYYSREARDSHFFSLLK